MNKNVLSESVVLLKLGCQEFAGKDDMLMKNVGVSVTFPLHTHNYYEYFLVTNGRAIHHVNDLSQVVSRGSLVFVRPSDIHCYGYYQKDDFEFWNAGITEDLFMQAIAYLGIHRAYIDSPRLPRHVHLDNKTMQDVNSMLTTLKNTPDGEIRNKMFHMVLVNILFNIYMGDDATQHIEIPSWMLQLIEKMDQPENFVEGLPKLLELANYSQAYVNRTFRQYLYTTPTQYINNLRLRYAYRLIASTDLSILEIANACGFNNISYFYTIFKKQYACCPNELRVSKKKK